MEGVFALVRHRRKLIVIYLATLFLSFHYFITIYVNSSLLSAYVTPEKISLLYIVGSLINIGALLFFTPLLRMFGNDRLLILFSITELGAVLGLAFFDDPALILGAFILHQALPPLILFTLDIFLEGTQHDETKTGGLRGVFLTVSSLALVLSPLILSATVTGNDFSKTYLLSALFLLPLLILAYSKTFSRFPDPHYKPLHLRSTVLKLIESRNLRGVFMANFLLQLFYAWMVVYTPIYLRDVGLSWQEIGLVFTFMLLPFLLFELPIGRLADTRYGEKEFMATGFIILSLSTALMSFVVGPMLIVWAVLLFITRTGASMIEITSESYFFKKVVSEEANLISFFRMTRPLSFIAGPLIGALILSVFPLHYAFLIFAIILSSGIFFSLSIRDTR